jgi:rhamnogalacturonyl hydrolase YesR
VSLGKLKLTTEKDSMEKTTAMKIMVCLSVIGLVATWLGCAHIASQKSPGIDLGPWPQGRSPHEIGKRVAERYVTSPYGNFGRTTPPRSITYPETCTWYGALTFAALTSDKDLTSRLVKRFEPLLSDQSSLIPRPDHVDHSVFGVVPFEIYIQTKDKRCLELARHIADTQWVNPIAAGLTPQTRMWIDDMYMIISLQTQAYRATGDRIYLDRAALEMSVYLDTLQQANGLFYHAPDVPFYWGRGNGWVASGMTEILRDLPANHPRRGRILAGYTKMMSTLLKHQDANGIWHQLIDKPDSWPETSCTGMFTFAMITGVKNGWLDEKTYGPAARKGWLGLITYLNQDGDVREVCEGTNKKNDPQYYIDRKRNVGDFHGQAPILWCASALLR